MVANESTSRRPVLLVRIIRGAFLPLVILLLVPAAFFIGYATRGADGAPPADMSEESEAQSAFWSCSMHPQVRQPDPGKCPICSMDLILVTQGGDTEAGPPRLVTSEAARALMDIQTSPVERRAVMREVRMVGKLDYDETGLASITAWVPGRLDRLYVDYTGVQVKKGDHLVYLYSPDLLAAQNDLKRAAQALDNLRPNAPDVLKKTAQLTLDGSREKLRRWGLTDGQIDRAEKQGVSSEHVTIYAPIAGTVIHRSGQEGAYVSTGTAIYTIADLTTLWVQLDAYESDLAWLRYGQPVSFVTEAYPGETFEGRVTFIDPMLDKMTRTAKVRVIVANEGGRLKPEMFVRATVLAEVTEGGGVRAPALAGKWISPMHPEVIKDGPGTCDVCGMALVPVEELGLVDEAAGDLGLPLVIPASAALLTGTRAVVYVEVPDAEQPTYEGREVVLGPRAGDFYTVREGLQEGERVVTNGNFKIDSALQIQAKPSMMNPAATQTAAAHDHAEHGSGTKAEAEEPPQSSSTPKVPAAFRKQLRAVSDAYLATSEALASDDFAAAAAATKSTAAALKGVDMALLEGDAHMRWMPIADSMTKVLSSMTAAQDIEALRASLLPLTKHLIAAIEAFGVAPGAPLYQAYCPMAFDGDGGDWLQTGQVVRNAYYGDMMLNCGSIKRRIDQTEEGAQDE